MVHVDNPCPSSGEPLKIAESGVSSWPSIRGLFVTKPGIITRCDRAITAHSAAERGRTVDTAIIRDVLTQESGREPAPCGALAPRGDHRDAAGHRAVSGRQRPRPVRGGRRPLLPGERSLHLPGLGAVGRLLQAPIGGGPPARLPAAGGAPPCGQRAPRARRACCRSPGRPGAADDRHAAPPQAADSAA